LSLLRRLTCRPLGVTLKQIDLPPIVTHTDWRLRPPVLVEHFVNIASVSETLNIVENIY
jgi:hypothetical protein